MAAEQLSRGDNETNEREIHVEKERVPQLASHFEAIAVQGKATDPITAKPTVTEKTEHSQRTGGISKAREDEEKQRIEGQKPEETHELAAEFESVADKVRDDQRDQQARVGEEQRISEKAGEQRGSEQRISEKEKRNKGEMGSHQNQPSLEEISNYRALAQEKSNEAIRAAKERYDKDSSRDTKTEEAEEQRHTEQQHQAVSETVKEKLTSGSKTAKEYTAPIAEKAKGYTVTAGQASAQLLGQKAVAAKDVTIESGKVAAEYAGTAAEDLKEKAAVAGWSTAHYSCDTAVEGTKAAARLVKGAAEYAGALAAKPLCAAKDVAESAGENVREYTARKKEEAQRESMYKKGEKESLYEEKTKESFEGGKEQVKERDDGGILGAIGETIYEIAQTTKEIVIGGDETEKQRSLGFALGQEEYYQTGTRKGTRA